MKNLGLPQYNVFFTYLDCKRRTKKEIEFPKDAGRLSDDAKLVRFMLENSSITDRESERSFSHVADAINIMCKQLCPGQWCTRSHCKNYSRKHAYNCTKTRPSVCKEYKAYIEKKKLREEKEKGDL